MSLFENMPPPWVERGNSSAAAAAISGYNARTARESVELQRQSRIEQLQFRENQMRAQMEASKELVDQMRAFGVEDEEGMARFLVKNPGAALSPLTAPLVKNLSSVFSNMTRVQLAASEAATKTYEGRVKQSLANTFWKDLAAVPPTYQAAVLEMEQDPAKVPNGDQFKALGIINERVKAENEAKKLAEEKAKAENKILNVPPGGKVFNPATGKMVFENPSAAAQGLQTETEKIPAVEAVEAAPAKPGYFGTSIGATPEVKAVKGHGEITIKRTVPSGKAAAETGQETAKYQSEEAARTAGAKAGDVIYLEGVGKVKLR